MARRQSKTTLPLILSYVFDWVIIILAAVAGGLIARVAPYKRPFSIHDPNISFPIVDEQVSTVTLCVVAVLVPAVVILFVSFVLVPGPTVSKATPKKLIWRRKLWEWYIGWTGLALSNAAAFFITSGMKNLFGKPRPHTLAACNPDMANLANYIVGGFGESALVSAAACLTTDSATINETFRSFPSGHSSTSAAGLIYLSLFLASKLAITIPFLAPRSYSSNTRIYSAFPSRLERHMTPMDRGLAATNASKDEPTASEMDPFAGPSAHNDAEIAARNQSAAPPVYLLVFAIAPIGAAIYICSTRFAEFFHFGFDILFGFSIGLVTAIYSFRFYHLPISQGAGWAWGPRSHKRAFWTGIGVGTYAKIDGDDEFGHQPAVGGGRGDLHDDVEAGSSSNTRVGDAARED